MKGKEVKKTSKEPAERSVTERGKHYMREELYMSRLSDRERKAYEECLALLQGLSGDGSLEEACEMLEKLVSRDNED